MSKDQPTRKELVAAREELRRAGRDELENDRFHAANDKVAAIEAQMPWWKKW